MRVEWALTCRYAEAVANQGVTVVGGGADTIGVPTLPAILGLSVLLRVMGLPDEFAQHKMLEISVLDPLMEPIGDPLTYSLDAEVSPQHRPGWEQTTFLPVGVQWPANVDGVYTLRFSVEGQAQTLAIIVKTD